VIKEQKGFTVVESILVIVAVAALAVTGWVLYQAENEAAEVGTTTPEQSRQSEEQSSEVPDDWQEYSNTSLGFSFAYPGQWRLNTETDGGSEAEITLETPDLKYEEMDIGGHKVAQGAELTVRAWEASDEDRKKFREFGQGERCSTYIEEGSFAEKTTVDGNQAYECHINYEGDGDFNVHTIANGNSYIFSFNGDAMDETESTHFAAFQQILGTAEL
jgi:Tfp pilus assembly major pilin PilA